MIATDMARKNSRWSSLPRRFSDVKFSNLSNFSKSGHGWESMQASFFHPVRSFTLFQCVTVWKTVPALQGRLFESVSAVFGGWQHMNALVSKTDQSIKINTKILDTTFYLAQLNS